MINYTVGKKTKIFPGAQISPYAIIGKNCKISSGVMIGRCQLGDNVYVGFRANIYNGVVIGNNVKIEKYVTIFPGSVINDGAILESNCAVEGIVGPNDKIGANSNYVKHILR